MLKTIHPLNVYPGDAVKINHNATLHFCGMPILSLPVGLVGKFSNWRERDEIVNGKIKKKFSCAAIFADVLIEFDPNSLVIDEVEIPEENECDRNSKE